jgi:hypothetical protein
MSAPGMGLMCIRKYCFAQPVEEEQLPFAVKDQEKARKHMVAGPQQAAFHTVPAPQTKFPLIGGPQPTGLGHRQATANLARS